MKALFLSTSGDNTLDLPLPLEVEGYGCGIIEISGQIDSLKSEQLFLCCDICEESFTGKTMMPILRNIKRRTNGIIIN